MRALIIFIVALVYSSNFFGQSIVINPQEELKGTIYNKEWSGGIRLHTNGWSFFGEYAKIKNIHKTLVMQFGFQEFKDYREKKQSAEFTFIGPNLDSPKDFYYGKRNQFYTLRYSIGQRRTLGNKAEKNGVRVSYIYMAGISLGFLKPYYLNLAYAIPDNSTGDIQTFAILTQKYTEENADKFLDWFSISGASGWGHGFKEIEPIPGGYGKLGLSFDWASKDEFVKILEVGVHADIFYKKVLIMATDDNKGYFLGAYVSFQFGKRSLKRY